LNVASLPLSMNREIRADPLPVGEGGGETNETVLKIDIQPGNESTADLTLNPATSPGRDLFPRGNAPFMIMVNPP
jgi:hypothetical protein